MITLLVMFLVAAISFWAGEVFAWWEVGRSLKKFNLAMQQGKTELIKVHTFPLKLKLGTK